MKNNMSSSRKRGCRFWIGRALIVVGLIVIVPLVAGFLYQTIATANDSQNFPPPGTLVDIGGYNLHLYCVGEGSPTVILNAAQPFTVSSWAWVQPEVAKTTRVCAYDRSGLGWSDLGPEPLDSEHNGRELHILLEKAGIEPPYVLVGHSWGGLTARMYAAQYPDEVVGIVLVDASHPDEWEKLGLAEGTGGDKNMLAMGPVVSRFGLTRLIDFVGFDLADLPNRQQEELRAFYATTKFTQNSLAVDTAFPASLAQVRTTGDLRDMPLVVLTTGEKDQATTAETQIQRDLQLELAALSSNSRYQVVEDATHLSLVHNQQHAQSTIAAILEVIQAIREEKPLSA